MIAALIRLCIHKRLAAVLMTLVVATYGLQAYFNTPIEAYPDVTNVQVNVVAQLSGAAPEEIERQVTIPLERALNGTPDMIQMRSESLFGLSILWLVFNDEADAFKARTRVAERLLNAELPDDAAHQPDAPLVLALKPAFSGGSGPVEVAAMESGDGASLAVTEQSGCV